MRAEPGSKFKFIEKITDSIIAVNTFFNLGQEFSNFKHIVEILKEEGVDIVAMMPRFFSDTRFANYSSLVFDGFIENYPAFIRGIVEAQEKGRQAGATENQKKKADKCAGLQAEIYSLDFLTTLSGMRDAYSNFSKTVNILQIVNILPHEKYDLFEEGCRGKLKKMMETVKMCDCGCHPAREPQSSTDEAEEEVFVIRDDLAAGCTGNREDDHQCCQENGEGCCHKGGQVCCMESWEVCYREGGEISYKEGGEVCFREIGEVCCREGREKCCREAGDGSLRREAKLVKPLEGSSVEDLVTVENVQIEENKNLSERDECLWPSLHNHLREWQEKRTVCGVTMGYLWGDQLKPGLR